MQDQWHHRRKKPFDVRSVDSELIAYMIFTGIWLTPTGWHFMIGNLRGTSWGRIQHAHTVPSVLQMFQQFGSM